MKPTFNTDKKCSYSLACNKCENNDPVFGYVYNVAQGQFGSQTIQACDISTDNGTSVIKFNRVGPLSGIRVNKMNTLILPIDGIYEASYTTRAIPDSGSSISLKLLRISKNNIISTIPGSIYSSAISLDGTATINGIAKFFASSCDKIQLVNNTTSSFTLNTRSTDTSALINISNKNKISQLALVTISNSTTSYNSNIVIQASTGNSIYVLVQYGEIIGVSVPTEVIDNGNNIYLRAGTSNANYIIHTDIWYADNISVPINNQLEITLVNYENITVQTVTEVLEIEGAAFPSFYGIRNSTVGTGPVAIASIFSPENTFGLASFAAISTVAEQSFSSFDSDFFLPNPSINSDGNLYVAGAAKGQELLRNQTNTLDAVIISAADLPLWTSLAVSIIPASLEQIPVGATATASLANGLAFIPIQLEPALSRSIYVTIQYTSSSETVTVSDSEGHIYHLASSESVSIESDTLLITSIWFTDLSPTDLINNLIITVDAGFPANGFAEVVEIIGANNPSFNPVADPPLSNSNSGNNLRPFVLVPPFSEPNQLENFGLMSVAAIVTSPTNEIVFRPLTSFSIIPPIMPGNRETISGIVFGNRFHTTPIVMRTVIDNVSQSVIWVATAIAIQFPGPIPPIPMPLYCEPPINASLNITLLKKL